MSSFTALYGNLFIIFSSPNLIYSQIILFVLMCFLTILIVVFSKEITVIDIFSFQIIVFESFKIILILFTQHLF